MYKSALLSVQQLNNVEEHVKNYRPQVCCNAANLKFVKKIHCINFADSGFVWIAELTSNFSRFCLFIDEKIVTFNMWQHYQRF